MTIRLQVIEQIIKTIEAAERYGKNDFHAVMATYSGTPEGVYWEAWVALQYRREEAWWQAIEKTIDGEIIKAALIKSGGAH